MLPSRTLHKSRLRQLGFSLVELMVSIVIGLIILAGVVQVVFTSKATFLAQEDMSYIQENARFALSVIGKDIRGAGYWGCTATNARSAMVLNVAAGDANTLASVAGLTGYDSASTVAFPADGTYTRWPPTAFESATTRAHDTESFVVQYAGGKPLSVLYDDGGSDIMHLEGAEPIAVGDYLVAASLACDSFGVFSASSAVSSGSAPLIQHAVGYQNGLNCSTKIKLGPADDSFTCPGDGSAGSNFYFPGASVMKFIARGYFIEQSGVLAGQPALKRVVLTAAGATEEEEIALGIEDMLLLYGVKTATGVQLKQANLIAEDEWPSVTSVQVSLVFRSQSQSLPAPSTNTYLGNTYGDRYLRQVVTSTFKLRNRI